MPSDDAMTMTGRLAAALADHYRVERELGQGGMATVYLAHDLKHDRDVAIKVLHPDLGAALGGERFLSEIRTTARLQHPHILPLLDSGEADGLLYYVMPLVTGETLRARLDREQQLPIEDALQIAREVADALGYAHGLGVIHRDIKPENILLQDGHASVADFGIALAVQSAGGQRMTQTGLSLGTPQYMSPEQAMGERAIDARTDIYALGAVTYEMLAGEPPFTGPTVQAIVARLLSEEPRSLGAQRKSVPGHVEHAVRRALEKLPADRWTSAPEFAAALASPAATTEAEALRYSGAHHSRSWRDRLRDPVVLALGALTVATVSFAAWARVGRAAEADAPVVRFSIPAGKSASFGALGLNTLGISADGTELVYVGEGANGRQQLMLRPVDDIDSRPIEGSSDGNSPVISPDGKWLAYTNGPALFKVPVTGGRPQALRQVTGTFNGMSWSSTAGLVVSGNTALYLVPETGGEPRVLTRADGARDELFQDAPVVVDAAGIVLYSSWGSAGMAGARIAVASLAGGETTILDVLGTHPLGLVDGQLVYVTAGGALMAVPFDAAKRRTTGDPVQLASDLSVNSSSGLARAALSATGTLFYQSGSQVSQVVLAGVRGGVRALLAEAQEYGFPRLSPDAGRLAVTRGSSGHRDIWVYELSSGIPTRLTTEGATNERPEWTPDGKRVLFRSDRGNQRGRSEIWWRPADLSAPESLLQGGAQLDVYEAVFSPDGRFLVVQIDTSGADLYYRAVEGDTTLKAIAATPAIESMPRVSPDGRWIAFVTDESGANQVVVQPFPGPGGRIQVSGNGGTEPVWSRDGRRLFYRGDGRLMAASVRTDPTFAVVARDTVFADRYIFANNPHANYDVMPDGEHFVMLQSAGEGVLTVVVNFGAALRARMAGRGGR